MKIGFDGKRALHNMRGLGNYSRALIDSLTQFYPENDYLIFSPKRGVPERGTQWLGSVQKIELIGPENFWRSMPSFLWRSFHLSKLIEQKEIQLYHGLSHELPLTKENKKRKQLVTIHDLIFMREPQFFPWWDRQVYKKKFSYSCEVADKVIAISEQTKNDLVEYLKVPPSKIEVVYQCCDPIFYHSSTGDSGHRSVLKKYEIKRPYFLCVGALESRKNTMGVLSAYHQLKNNRDVDLVFVGKGDRYAKEMNLKIQKWNLEDQVHILSTVAFSELPALYAEALATLYPSFFEGFGLPIVESLFCKTPVITSKGSCFSEAGGPGALYINPRSEAEISNAMLFLLENVEKRFELAQLGFEHVQQFRMVETAKKMMNVYQSLF